MSGRAESLEAPAGARRAPFVGFLLVATVAALALVVGSTLGWFVLFLAPVAVFLLWVLVRVVAAMRSKEEG